MIRGVTLPLPFAGEPAGCLQTAVHRPVVPHLLRPGLRVLGPAGPQDGVRHAGRPRTKGDRLPALDGLAVTAAFTQVTVTRYGKAAAISAAAITCLWPSVFGTRTVTVVLIRDRSASGHDLALVTTDTAASPARVSSGTPPGGASKSRSRTPGRSSAPGRPATAPPAPSSGPSRSSSPVRPSPPAGTPPPATTPPTWPITAPAPPGTPARLSRDRRHGRQAPPRHHRRKI